MRAVFTNREDLEFYLRVCEDPEIKGSDTESGLLELYMLGQSTRILKHLHVQDLRKMAWEMFYFCTASHQQEFEQVLDETILNILTGDMSEVESIRLQLEVC